MRRNHSLDSNLTTKPRCDEDTSYSTDDSDSLHSRRKKRHGQRFKGTSSTTTTMTIKTFRQVQREKLRRKCASTYSSPDYDVDEQHGFRAHRCNKLRKADVDHTQRRCRNQPKRHPGYDSHSNSDSSNSSASHCRSNGKSSTAALPAPNLVKNRSSRKVDFSNERPKLRFRSPHNDCAISSARRLRSAHSTSSLASLQMLKIERSLRVLQSQVTDALDPRPRKRESDCSCCNDAKLCDEVRHIADTSTEEWVVENAVMPKKSQSKSKSTKSAKPRKQKLTPPPKIILEKPKTGKGGARSKAPPLKAKVEKAVKQEKIGHSEDDSEFERELEKAVKLSKQLFEEEQARNKQSKNKKATPKKRLSPYPIYISDDEPANINLAANESVSHSAERTLKPQPKFAKLRKLAKTLKTTGEETFFAQGRKIYNSTALTSDGTAMQRQFSNSADPPRVELNVDKNVNKAEAKVAATTEKKSMKRVAALSTTKSTTASTSQSSSQIPPPAIAKRKEKNYDCNVVSSTTDDPQLPSTSRKPPAAAPAPATSQQQQQRYTRTAKGILLYTPSNRSLAPEHSFSGDTFNLTMEHLSAVIGERNARNFFRNYLGRRRFSCNSTIYYRPPPPAESSLDSEDDVFEAVNKCGELYESIEKSQAGTKK